jgi:hypothetical protein
MTAHISDNLINDHPRVKLRGLQPFGVICGNIRANYGWGDHHYKFANPGCSGLWKGCTATFRLDAGGQLELISYQLPNSSPESQAELVNEKLSGDFWLVLKPERSGPRTYVRFKQGTIVEDQSAWLIHEPQLGRISGDEQIIDVAARFMLAQVPGQVIEEAGAFPSIIAAGNVWLVNLRHRSPESPDNALTQSIVIVEEATRRPTWAEMSEEEWERSDDPHRMMLAVFRRVDTLLFWRLVCVLGRRIWDGLRSEQERFAIATTERWLDHRETEDELNGNWFCATGSGAGRQSGWAFAHELVDEYAGTAIPLAETCDLLRKMLGNPFRVSKGD